jgi:hypothetical protein
MFGHSAMSRHFDDFKRWFSDIVAGLYTNDHAGFAILMITIPVLERYLREKSRIYEGDLTDPFYDGLRRVFPTLPNNVVAREFYHVYRNGLLHQVTLSRRTRGGQVMPNACVSKEYLQALKIVASGNFLVHPVEFAKTVIQTIEADFATFEGQGSVNHLLSVPHSTGPTGPTGPA